MQSNCTLTLKEQELTTNKLSNIIPALLLSIPQSSPLRGNHFQLCLSSGGYYHISKLHVTLILNLKNYLLTFYFGQWVWGEMEINTCVQSATLKVFKEGENEEQRQVVRYVDPGSFFAGQNVSWGVMNIRSNKTY